MEALGEKFRKARMARNLTLEEAARMTKIRPNKLGEIEAEDFSNFPSLAYAKGFVQIYGKFLNVDVSPYLEAFESSEHMTVDGYSYLQDNPAPKPRRTEVVRREPSGRKGSLLPLVIAIVVLIAGFTLLKLMMDIRRIKPASQRDAQALAQPSAAPPVGDSSGGLVAPRALPAEDMGTPPVGSALRSSRIAEPVPQASTTTATTAPSGIAAVPTPMTTPQSAFAATSRATDAEPEVRRAEPVNPEDLQKAQAAIATGSRAENRFDIRPLRKTYVKVVIDDDSGGSFERWLDASGGPVQLRGQRITVKVLNPGDLEIRKNGKIVSGRDADITMQ